LIPSTIAFSVAFNVPKFFELTTTTDAETGVETVVPTDLRQNEYYKRFYVREKRS